MITKPIALYPDAISISPKDDKLRLTATYPSSCTLERFIGDDGLEYCYATLFMADEFSEYKICKIGLKFENENAGEKIYKETYSPIFPRVYDENNTIRLEYNLDLSDTNIGGVAFYCDKYDDVNGTIKTREFKLSELKNSLIYRWRVRIYEKNSILNSENYIAKTEIAYGTIQQANSGYYGAGDKTVTTIAIFPHINIYDYVLGQNYPYTGDYEEKRYIDIKESYYVQRWIKTNEYGSYVLCKQNGYDGKFAYYGKNEFGIGIDDVNKYNFVLNNVQKKDEFVKYYIKTSGENFLISQYSFLGWRYIDRYFSSYRSKECTHREYYLTGYMSSGVTYHEEYVDEVGMYPTDTHAISNDEISNGWSPYMSGGVPTLKNGELTYESGHVNYCDSYGNPLTGYAMVDGNHDLRVGSSYKIATNYIDSDEAYFEMYSTPKISIIENICSISFTDRNGSLIRATENNPYVMDYCNLDISLTINQKEGVESDSFNYRIYRKDTIGNYEEMFFSGNIYSSDLRVKYDDLLDNSEYKIAVSIFYSNNTSTTTDLYFNTKFAKSISNFAVKAEYCREHGSMIIEWSNVKSINPDISNENYEFVNLGERKIAYVGNKNKVTYYKNDFGTLLNFDKSVVAVKFKPTELSKNIINIATNDNKYSVKMARLENVDIGDCQDAIIVTSGKKSYTYIIKNRATTEEAIQAMESGVNPTNKTIVWHNDMIWRNSYKWFNGQNTTDSDYLVIIMPDGVPIVKNLTLGIEYDMVKESIITPFFDSASKAILYGNTYFQELTIINHFEQYMIDNLLNNEWVWTEQTQLLVKFNGNFNGAALETADSKSSLVGYKIYKKIGKEDRSVYKIADIDNNSLTVCEDFLIGANCEYQYFVYPVFSPANNEKKLSTNDPAVSDVLTLSYVPIKTVGLSKIDDNIYTVDIDNVWRFELNVEDNGYTLNNSKTFMDSLNRYNQEYVGNLNYITKDVSGLIGMIDCYSSDRGLIDTYDILTSWNNFSTSANLKCLIDSRGLILPGNFEQNPSVEYKKCSAAYASVKFNYRQKSDLDIIQVYATVLPFNPLHSNVLQSSDDYILTSKDNMLLLSTR